MDRRSKNDSAPASPLKVPECDCCQDQPASRRLPRREFLAASGAALGAAAIGGILPAGRVWAQAKSATEIASAANASAASSPESLVKVLYNTLSPGQREA